MYSCALYGTNRTEKATHVPRATSTDGEVPRCQNSSPVAEVQQCVDKASERHSQVSVTATGGARLGEEMLVDGPLLEVPPAQHTPGSVLRGAASQYLAERGGEGSPQRGRSMAGGRVVVRGPGAAGRRSTTDQEDQSPFRSHPAG